MPQRVQTEHLLAAILSSSEDGLLSFTLDGIVQTWSRGAELLYGYSADEIVGRPLARLLPAFDAPRFDGLLHAAIRGEFPQYESAQRLHKNGSVLLLGVRRVPIRNESGDLAGIVEAGKALTAPVMENSGEAPLKLFIEQMPMVVWSPAGEIIGCIGAGLDITERKKTEEKMRYQVTHDALTGLANYREFLDTLEREVRRGERSKRSFAVLLLDLDALKSINDRLGHLAGNQALKRLSEVRKEQSRSTDLAARYGGDEFAVLLIDSDPGMARQIAARVQSALANGREEPRLSVSIGVSVYPDDGRSAQELLESADRELYQRKRTVRGRGVPARAR
jgi:diguanylate cyclase (GGDEF)-like protein/PAS domain S-box-containing protein